MFRALAFAVILSCFVTSASAQVQPPPSAAPSGTSAPKPAAKKPATKGKAAVSQPAPVESGPCQIGVISALGNKFTVQKVGLTVFGNELAEVPVDWGFDDLVIARVRAAAGGGVRRIAYPREAFAAYDNPAPSLFRNPKNDLTVIVRQITANAGCVRYVAVTKSSSQVEGTNQALPGIGVYHRGIGSLVGHTRLFSAFQMTVFDGQTYEIRKNPFNLGSALARGFTEDPLTKLDNSAFPEPAATAAASPVLRDGTRALLASYLDKMLPGLLGQ